MFARFKDLFFPRRPTFRQFVKFGIVGACNTVLDFAVYLALTRTSAFWGEHIIMAATVSFLVAVASSFFFNNFWTFRRDANDLSSRSIKFLIVATGGLCWNALILGLLTRAGMYDIIAKLIATGMVLAWNFTMQKRWTFRA